MGSENEIPPVSPSAERTHPKSALDAAIAYLRRGLRRDGSYKGVDEWDFTIFQWNRLHSWALAQSLVVPTHIAPNKEGGREHDVCFDDARQRWLKFTKPSMAGYAVEIVDGQPQMSPASPLRYLERWELHNRLFFDDVEFIGIRSEGYSHRLVVSQKDWGADFPDWDEIERAMLEDYELERLPLGEGLGGYEARAYRRGRFAVFDVRPANCARSAEGLIMPYDVIPQVFRRSELAALRIRR